MMRGLYEKKDFSCFLRHVMFSEVEQAGQLHKTFDF